MVMHKLRLVLAVLAASMSLMGMSMMAIAARFLWILENSASGDMGPFYTSLRHYGALGWHGALVGLGGCAALAVLLHWKKSFQAAKISGVGAFLSLTFGLFFFPIHFPSGAMYFSLLTFTSGACAAFALAGTARYMWFRTHQSSGSD